MSLNWLSLSVAGVLGLSLVVTPSTAPVQAHANDGPPPEARPGECYGRVLLAPTYERVSKQVLEREAWTETLQDAPVTQKVTRKVLVRPATVKRVQTAAVYETRVRWETRPGKRRTVVEPARYKTVTKRVLVSAARSEWRLQSQATMSYGTPQPGQTRLTPTGEVYCKVLIPAVYDTVSTRVKVAEGRSYTVEGPARKVKRVERVLVREGGWVEKTVPAVYRTEVVKTVVRPGGVRTVTHPAVYRTVEQPVLKESGRQSWARVVCGGAIAPAFMQRVQQSLIAQGYDPGPPNGVGTEQTYAALRRYQSDRGLAQGQLTVESAQALGVL